MYPGKSGRAHGRFGGGTEVEVSGERDSQDQPETDGRYSIQKIPTMASINKISVIGETIKKKYNSILDMLKRERLTFSNQLESLESQIRKQGC